MAGSSEFWDFCPAVWNHHFYGDCGRNYDAPGGSQSVFGCQREQAESGGSSKRSDAVFYYIFDHVYGYGILSHALSVDCLSSPKYLLGYLHIKEDFGKIKMI